MTLDSRVPTREEILDALRILEIEPEVDRLGRRKQKNWTSVPHRLKWDSEFADDE